jgi:Domain of unknown function (DUF4180)
MKFREWPPRVALMRNVDDAGLVIEGCYSIGVDSALLHAENLTECFFDLSSGEAGAILQKLRNYKIRIAVVYSPDSIRLSSRFGEMAIEEGRTGYFRLFESDQAAREWLSTDRSPEG